MRLKKFISYLLCSLLVISSFDVGYAGTQLPGTNNVGAGATGSVSFPAYAFRLSKNNLEGPNREIQTSQILKNPNLPANTGLIVDRGTKHNGTCHPNVFKSSPDSAGKVIPNSMVYTTSSSGTAYQSYKYHEMLAKKNASPTKTISFKMWQEVYGKYDATKYGVARDSFVALFRNVGNLSTAIEKSMTTSGRDTDIMFLDLLSVVNIMTGGKSKDVIKYYIENNISDKSVSQASYIEVVNVAGIYDAATGQHELYPNSVYYAEMFKQRSRDFYKVQSGGKYSSGGESFMKSEANKFSAATKGKPGKPGYWNNAGVYSKWPLNTAGKPYYNSGSSYNYRYTAIPKGKNADLGESGYTFIVNYNQANKITIDESGCGLISLKASPKSKTVKMSENVSADLQVSLAVSAEASDGPIRMNLIKFYDKYKGATITLDFSMETLKGVGSSPKLIDQASYGQLSGNRITIPNVSRVDFLRLLDGKLLLDLKDNNIIITEATENLYKVTGNIKFAGAGPTCKLVSRGALIPDTYTAADKASWGPEIGVLQYNSKLEDPFAEIKENDPRNENFEAMAGVPTTRDLYLGFGASEFVLNQEALYKTQTDAKRRYILTYRATNCWEDNTKCSYSCPGKVTDSKGKVTHAGPHSKLPCGAASCADPCTTNQWHPHVHEWVGVITQEIASFNYVDITDMSLWQLNRCKLEGNADLMSTPNVTIDPKTGYRVFCETGPYKDQSGRLFFSFKWEEPGQWGDAYVTKETGTGKIRSEHDKDATAWMNSMIAGKTTNAKVVSDYVSLNTSEGYQVAMYHEYLSNTVPIAAGQFIVGSDRKELSAPTITFPRIPTKQEMWDNNGQSAAKWTPEHITRSGYNGKFATPSVKWVNGNITQGSDPAEWCAKEKQPVSKHKEGSKSHAKDSNNLRLTEKNLNIIDSTDSNRNWSESDGVEPVTNGIWDTGEATIEYDNEVMYETPQAPDLGSPFILNAPYSPDHDSINDIVIHNPVSVQKAVVISNDKKYDRRSAESLVEGGDPPKPEVDGCPKDETCMYSHLTCNVTPTPHKESCWQTVDAGQKHVGGANTHEHNSRCYGPVHIIQRDTKGSRHIHCIGGCGDYMGDCTGPGCTLCAQNVPLDPNNTVGTEKVVESRAIAGELFTYHYEKESVIQYYKCSECSLIFYPGYSTHHYVNGSSSTYCGARIYPVYSDYKVDKLVIDKRTPVNYCTNILNKHVCTGSCTGRQYEKVLTCTDPHHYTPGEPHDKNAASSHYAFPDQRCYTYCGNDSKHKPLTTVTVPGKPNALTNEVFINLDRSFEIYYPDVGDFEQSPNLHGIAECTPVRGMGYTDNMNTAEWLRNKYVTFPVHVIDSKGRMHLSNTMIDLLEIQPSGDTYKFYAPLANSEWCNADVKFHSIGNNAPEIEEFDDAVSVTNRDRDINDCGSPHTASKVQQIDVVGYIGNLTLEDTGDYRFSTLFKQPVAGGGWLVTNLVPKVNYSAPNKILSDNIDLRGEKVEASTRYHGTYGVTDKLTGGKHFQHVSLPLTPNKNPISALRKQPMRPGYKLYMDIETAGNYYGETYDDNENLVDANMYYKTQITPKYWSLNLDTGTYKPVDVYMGTAGNYKPVVLHNQPTKGTEFMLYLNWLEEAERRNYTVSERNVSMEVKKDYEVKNITADGTREAWDKLIRLPLSKPEVLGSGNMLFLNDLNRTFIGSSNTYGVNKNPNIFKTSNKLPESFFNRQSQRNHFTLGLPSSAIFVEADRPCTTEEVEKLSKANTVIVCTANIMSRGEVWTLEYDGTSINTADAGGFRITEGGKVYQPPEPKNPVIVVYSKDKTSRHDLTTEGSH